MIVYELRLQRSKFTEKQQRKRVHKKFTNTDSGLFAKQKVTKRNLEVHNKLIELFGRTFLMGDFLVKAFTNHANSLLAFE